MKNLLLTLFISFLALINRISAQQKFPEIHGLKIGMSARQIKKQLPFLKISKEDKYEIRDAFLYVTTAAKQRARFPRVFNVEMLFLKNQLILLAIKYYGSDQEKSNNYKEFVDLVTRYFDLNDVSRTSYRTYKKGGIEYQVGSENKKEVVLFDLRAKKIRDKQVFESFSK